MRSCGEESIYNLASKRGHCQLAQQQEEAILGKPVEMLPEKMVAAAEAGDPLFWQEIKPIGLLAQVFQDLGVSGACAIAVAVMTILKPLLFFQAS